MNVLVLFDYTGEKDDELTIKNGDIIQEVYAFENGWYVGRLNGRVGVFPDNFVKKIDNTDSGPLPTPTVDSIEVSSQRMIHSSQNGSNNDNELIKDKLQKGVVAVGLGNIFNGQQIELRQTAFKDVLKPGGSGEKGHTINQITAASQSDSDRAFVLFDYVPCEPDELELRVDDIIVILDRNLTDEGWWRGRNLRTNKTGVFPDNFVSPVSETKPFTSDPPPPTRSTQPSDKTATSPVLPAAVPTSSSSLPTQVGLVSAPLVASSPPNIAYLDGPTKAGRGKAEQGQGRTEAGGLKVSLSGAVTVSSSAMATTTTPTTTTTTSVASKASLFGGRFLQQKGLGAVPNNTIAKPSSTGLSNTVVKDVAPGATGSANCDATTNAAVPSNTPTTAFYTANRPRQQGRRLPKALQGLKIQASTPTGSSQGNSPKADLAPLSGSPLSFPNETPETEANQTRVSSRQTANAAAAASKFSENPAESNRAASGDPHKSGGSMETSRQPEVTPPSATRQTRPTDTRRTQADDGQLQQKLEELTSLYKNHIEEGKREMQELSRQVDSLKDSNAQLRSDLTQTQRRLTARLQTLMDELDEMKKQRASDVIELARLRSLFMQFDAKSLTGQTDECTDHQSKDKSDCWHQDRGLGDETYPDLRRDDCVERTGREQPHHHQRQRQRQQEQTQSHQRQHSRQGSQVLNSTPGSGMGEVFAEDSSQITPTDPRKVAPVVAASIAASLRSKQASVTDQSCG